MTSEFYEYNKRQLGQMNSEISKFENGESGLWLLITSLEGLVNALEDCTPTWKNSFLKQWGVFDEIYAVNKDNKQITLSGEDRELIAEAIEGVRKLINAF